MAFGAIALFSAGLLGCGLLVQHVEQLEPCPLCVLQCYAYVPIAAVALVTPIQNPRATGRAVYGGLITLIAPAGAGIALRQIWLIRHPSPAMTCRGDLAYYLESVPLTQALPSIFRGAGNCAADTWRLLGLVIPEWSRGFVAQSAAGVFLIFAQSGGRQASDLNMSPTRFR